MRHPRNTPAKTPPLLVTADPGLHEAVARIATAADAPVEHARTVAEARRAWHASPLILIGDDVSTDLCRASLPRREGVILIGRDLDDGSIWQRGTALGAQQVLFLPDAEGWLEGLLAEAGGDTAPRGPIVAVLSGRGGAGGSTLAAALAMTASRAGHRTTLVDLDPIGGGIDLLFGLESAVGPRWSELAQWRDGRLCGRSLREALPRYIGEPDQGLPILTWPRTLATNPADPVRADASRAVLGALAQAGDLVVVDLPRSLDEAAVEALAVATATLMVVPAEVRAAAAASQLAASVRLITGDLRAVVRMPSIAGLGAEDVADVVGLPLAGVIAPDRRMSIAAEHGRPPGAGAKGALPDFCRPFLESVLGPPPSHPRPDERANPRTPQGRRDFRAMA